MQKDEERRRWPRMTFDGWAEITAESSRHRGRCVDLSPEGICISFRQPLPGDLSLVVSEFALPGLSLPLAIEGRVAWCNHRASRLGLRFENLDPGIAELLVRYTQGRL